MPETITLVQMHKVIQIAMGWENAHLYQFMQPVPAPASGRGITRRQITNARIFAPQFEDEEDWGDDGMLDVKKVLLSELLPIAKSKILYVYDMGDSWEHEILLEKILPAEPELVYPQCVAGERACPVEDSGGVGGYDEMLRILSDPSDEEYEDILEWTGGKYDPEAFSLEAVNRKLAPRAKRTQPAAAVKPRARGMWVFEGKP